jgi:hypothetical protein
MSCFCKRATTKGYWALIKPVSHAFYKGPLYSRFWKEIGTGNLQGVGILDVGCEDRVSIQGVGILVVGSEDRVSIQGVGILVVGSEDRVSIQGVGILDVGCEDRVSIQGVGVLVVGSEDRVSIQGVASCVISLLLNNICFPQNKGLAVCHT